MLSLGCDLDRILLQTLFKKFAILPLKAIIHNVSYSYVF